MIFKSFIAKSEYFSKESFALYKSLFFGFLIIITIAFYVDRYHEYTYRKKIETINKSKCFTIGKVTHYYRGTNKSGASIDFSYSYKKQNYYGTNKMKLEFRPWQWMLKVYSFPVILDSTNPENSRILIRKKDFDDFNIKYPDSLSWIKDSLIYDEGFQ